MELPTDWSQIPLDLYLELRKVKVEDFQGVTGMMIEILSIVSGEDVEVIEEMPTKKIKRLYDQISFIHDTPNSKPLQRIELGGVEYRYKGMSLTLGEYIDLLSWNEGDIDADLIAAALYRRTRIGDWGELVFEPRVYNERDRADLFLALPTTKVWGVVNDFREFNGMIRDKYGDLFPEPEPEEKEEGDGKPQRRTLGSQGAAERQKAIKLHQWQKFVHDLCGGDVTKRLEVLRTPVIYIFNTLGMAHDLKEN